MDHMFREEFWKSGRPAIGRRWRAIGLAAVLAAIAIEVTVGGVWQATMLVADFLGPGGLAGLTCFGIVAWIFYLNLR